MGASGNGGDARACAMVEIAGSGSGVLRHRY